MTEYHHLINQSAWFMVYSNTTVYGGFEYGISGHLHISLFEALNNEEHFLSGLHLYTLSQTLIACRVMQFIRF